MNKLLHPPSSEPDGESTESCAKKCKELSKFFIDKIRKIKEKIASKVSGIVSSGCEGDPAFVGAELRSISPVTPEEFDFED